MRNCMTLALAALAFAALPAAAADTPPAVATELQRISQQLGELSAKLGMMGKDITNIGLQTNKNAADIEDLQKKIGQLQQQLHSQEEAMRRAFSYTPTPLAPTGPAPGNNETVAVPSTGTILLRNYSSLNGTFFLNGQGYNVGAGQTVEVRGVPAGTFTYEIAAEGYGVIRPATTRVLTAGSPYCLNINPL